jgi:hypothetical protein
MYGTNLSSNIRNPRLLLVVLAALALLLTSVVVAPPASAATRPGSGNTGVPVGTAMKKYTGELVITTPGTVISGYDVYGYITVKAPNVTITKTRVRGGKPTTDRDLIRANDVNAYNLKVIDSTIQPDYPSAKQAIGIRLGASNQLVQRVNVNSTVDGIRITGKGARVESSWLHDFKHYSYDPYYKDGTHDDAIQLEGGTGIRILNNSFSGAYNAGVMVAQDRAAISDLQINNNWANGGGCTINIAKKSYPYMSGLVVNYNRFGRNQRNPNCAIVYRYSETSLKPVGNVWDDNGAAVKPTAY